MKIKKLAVLAAAAAGGYAALSRYARNHGRATPAAAAKTKACGLSARVRDAAAARRAAGDDCPCPVVGIAPDDTDTDTDEDEDVAESA